ncbi:MAG: Na+ dependent nucleoside transporter N-terminal domain-containing protein, partial [Rhodothermales bacterium]
MNLIDLLRGLLGLTAILGIAILISSDRKSINWRTVGAGLLLQVALAVLILKGDEMGAVFTPLGWPKAFFAWVSSFFVIVL